MRVKKRRNERTPERRKGMQALFVSIPAADYLTSKDFYEQAVGLSVAREYVGQPHRFTNYDLGGIFLKLYEWKHEFHGSGHTGLFIETDELDAVANRIESFSEETCRIVVQEWGSRCCTVTDPFGNMFTLIDSNQKGDI